MKKERILRHLKVLLAGTLHALKGTLAVATLAAGIALGCFVPSVNGYLAVGLFVAALLFVVAAVLQFYRCGRDMCKGRFSK